MHPNLDKSLYRPDVMCSYTPKPAFGFDRSFRPTNASPTMTANCYRARYRREGLVYSVTFAFPHELRIRREVFHKKWSISNYQPYGQEGMYERMDEVMKLEIDDLGKREIEVAGGFVDQGSLPYDLGQWCTSSAGSDHPGTTSIGIVQPSSAKDRDTLTTEINSGRVGLVLAEFERLCASDELRREMGGDLHLATLVGIMGFVISGCDESIGDALVNLIVCISCWQRYVEKLNMGENPKPYHTAVDMEGDMGNRDMWASVFS